MTVSLKNLSLLALMLCSAIVAWALTPHHRMASLNSNIKLESAIPDTFGEWKLDETVLNTVVNPQQAELLDILYSQTLTRSYYNPQGQRIMLSIAYGETQAGGIELHRPEVCYVAQGFSLETIGTSSLTVAQPGRLIPLQRLFAHQKGRNEPISYWMRVGDDIMTSGTSQQLSRVKQGLQGWIPDGVLFRVSSISDDTDSAYGIQESFIKELLAAVTPATRQLLVGPVSPSARNRP